MSFKTNITPEHLEGYFKQAKIEAAGRTLNAWINYQQCLAAEKVIEEEEIKLCRTVDEFKGDGSPRPFKPIEAARDQRP